MEPRELAAVSLYTEIAWCSLKVTLAQGSREQMHLSKYRKAETFLLLGSHEINNDFWPVLLNHVHPRGSAPSKKMPQNSLVGQTPNICNPPVESIFVYTPCLLAFLICRYLNNKQEKAIPLVPNKAKIIRDWL